MDLLHWSTPIWATLICSFPILAFAGLIAWRTKDLKAGIYLFLYPAAYVALLIFFSWLMVKFIPRPYTEILFSFFSAGCIIFISVTGALYWINANRAGRLKENSMDEMSKLNTIGGYSFLGLAVLSFLLDDYQLSSPTLLFPTVFAGRLLGQKFLSFQLRERGILSRGKLIKFEEINSMGWVDLRNKDEVEYTTKDSSQIRRLKIPWKFIIPIDNYIGAHFPRT
jgi:hypothetical protein